MNSTIIAVEFSGSSAALMYAVKTLKHVARLLEAAWPIEVVVVETYDDKSLDAMRDNYDGPDSSQRFPVDLATQNGTTVEEAREMLNDVTGPSLADFGSALRELA